MSSVCRFTFPHETDRETIEAHLALAIIAAECLFGKPRVRIDAAYFLSKEQPQIAIDVSTGVGNHVARIFTGLMIRQLGEEAFTVDRITKAA
jgi:hypothetical protein